jgi:hypothetical protein
MQKNKYKIIIRSLLFLILGMGFSTQSNASHLMGGNITYSDLGGGLYAINLTIFKDCKSFITNLDPTQDITFTSPTCGTETAVLANVGGAIVETPLCPSEPDRCDANNTTSPYGVESWLYRGTVQLPVGCGNDWIASWSLCCRNNAITTLTSAGNFYITSELDNTISNSSPSFNNSPAFFLCVNQENRYNGGMSDIENDSLVYSLTDCKTGPGVAPTGSVPYVSGITGQSPLFANYMNVDSRTGEVSVFPNTIQTAVICLMVEEYRNGVKIGSIIRDLQFEVTSCSNNTLPILSGINGSADSSGVAGQFEITACAGLETCFDIQGFDAEAVPSVLQQDIEIKWNYGINGASFVVDYNKPYPVGELCWTPSAADIGENNFFVLIEDNSCPIIGSNIYGYKINVVQGFNVDAGVDTTIGGGDTLQINAVTSGSNFSWSPTTGLSCSDCLNPIVILGEGMSIDYTLTVTDDNGCTAFDEITVSTFSVSTQDIPTQLSYWNVYPNPVTAHSVLEYKLSENSNVNIELFNILGEQMAIIEDQKQDRGTYQYQLNEYLSDKASGIYFVRMNINGKSVTQKIMLR